MSKTNENFKFDVIIIGAGIIGLAIANELASTLNNILVVEKESNFGKHVSSRNSEVIHSGIYYEKNSLKAQLCVKGNKLLYDFSRKYKIKYNNCGKIIIAKDSKEIAKLKSLMQNGIQNGLHGLQILNQKEVNEKEPLIKCESGLWVPSSGIIDSHGVMQTLEYLIKSKNNNIIYNTKLINIKAENNSYKLYFENLNYNATSKIIINCAGLWSDQISNMIGITDYKINFCKGEYYKTSKYRNKLNSLIYPLPTKLSLGIHIVLHLDGTISFGPNAYFVKNINYAMNDNYKKEFFKHINHYLKIKENELHEDFSGIRPKIQTQEGIVRDFIIKNEFEKGFNNFINLIGIESPGLTSSLAIAKYVQKIINF